MARARKVLLRRNPGKTMGAVPKRFQCRYCTKKFKTQNSATLHAILCKSNPNR